MAGWIGVDLDGTLAMHEGVNMDINRIGPPIPLMVTRIKGWLEDEIEVRIFTARVGQCGCVSVDGKPDDAEFAAAQRLLIEAWCEEHIGVKLPVTATKDFHMWQLWDDRAVEVVPNTGMSLRQWAVECGADAGRLTAEAP